MCRVFLGPLLVLALFLGLSQSVSAETAAKPILTHGPVIGAVTPTDARVFARTNKNANVFLRYSASPTMEGASETAVYQTTSASDWTTQIPLNSLQPNTVYYLDIVVNRVPQLHAPYPHFKTFPPQENPTGIKFAILTDFGTYGSNKPPLDYPVKTFKKVDAEHPDFVLIGGDFFHEYAQTIAKKRLLFRNNYQLNSPAAPMDDFVTKILYKYPLAHIWDDHDLGINNANKFYSKIGITRQVLQEYFPVYPLGAGGDYQTFTVAQSQFWLLDARSFRDPASDPDDENKSMLDGDNLGETGQLQWLLKGLQTSTARWKFVVSPVSFNSSLIKNDSWVGYKIERQKIIDFIETNNITGVVILSGDLHFGGIDDGTHTEFPEMLIPGPNLKTCATTHEPGLWSVGAYVQPDSSKLPCNGYGVVTIRTNPDRVLLQVKDQSGKTKLEYTVQ